VDYTEEVSFPGAKALRIRFDPRCCSETGGRTQLSFSTETPHKTTLCALNGPSSNWKSFVVHADRFHYRFMASSDSKNPGWGYKFTVSPLLGLSWSSEAQVLVEPSLEYACWILDFLLSKTVEQAQPAQALQALQAAQAPPHQEEEEEEEEEHRQLQEQEEESSLRVRSAVCTADVFEALSNYLRSPGAPYKKRVVYLITQLLKNPALFPTSDEPNLAQLEGVKKQVMKRCLDASNKNAGIVLPEGLQQLVEMILVTREAKQYFEKRKNQGQEKRQKRQGNAEGHTEGHTEGQKQLMNMRVDHDDDDDDDDDDDEEREETKTSSSTTTTTTSTTSTSSSSLTTSDVFHQTSLQHSQSMLTQALQSASVYGARERTRREERHVSSQESFVQHMRSRRKSGGSTSTTSSTTTDEEIEQLEITLIETCEIVECK